MVLAPPLPLDITYTVYDQCEMKCVAYLSNGIPHHHQKNLHLTTINACWFSCNSSSSLEHFFSILSKKR
ncbi:hypothetical protein L2E82_30437 [Cichorium intybus]|uniref:Uncharacterized protein n=1 Tax=Cichorium intybus TaxID=13427 RepID=A0ACB9D0K0_CICIN|nr:hypothetical protein L2E82_30437 [Cichorium intybus]